MRDDPDTIRQQQLDTIDYYTRQLEELEKEKSSGLDIG